MGNIKTPAE